jgi:hypothetical protein
VNGFDPQGHPPDTADSSGAPARPSRAGNLRLTRMPPRPPVRTGTFPLVPDPALQPGASPSGTGPSSTDPSSTGPSSTDPSSTGPSGTEPSGDSNPSGRPRRRWVRWFAGLVVIMLLAGAGAGWAYESGVLNVGGKPAPAPEAGPPAAGETLLPNPPLTENGQSGELLPSGVAFPVASAAAASSPAEPSGRPSDPLSGSLSEPPSASASPSVEAAEAPAAPAGKANPGGANLALGGVATASAVEGDPWLARYAIDGDKSTRWSSGFSDAQWIKLDLTEVWRLSEVTLHWEHAYGVAYAIEASADGRSWTSIYRTAAGKGGSVTVDAAQTAARYVRMSGTKRNSSYGYSLLEFEVR